MQDHDALCSQRPAEGLGGRSAQERVAHLLYELSVSIGTTDTGESSFDMPLTLKVMGDRLGLTPVHVSRTMTRLRAEGFITTSGRKVTILDTVRLHVLARFDPSQLN